jgi:DnaJ-class molecular chaperone
MSNYTHVLRLPWFVLTVVLGMAVLTAMNSCSQNNTAEKEQELSLDSPRAQQLVSEPQGQERPLRLDSGEAIQLLSGDDKATTDNEESSDHTNKQSASNESSMSYYVMCNDCHMGYIEEPLVLVHAKAGMSCDSCHGKSRAHYSDESNTTPPDKMYPADKINFFCQGCHHSHDVPAGKVVALWMQRNSDKTNPEKIICTDCHGEHRMKVRTIIWDKETGRRLQINRENR